MLKDQDRFSGVRPSCLGLHFLFLILQDLVEVLPASKASYCCYTLHAGDNVAFCFEGCWIVGRAISSHRIFVPHPRGGRGAPRHALQITAFLYRVSCDASRTPGRSRTCEEEDAFGRLGGSLFEEKHMQCTPAKWRDMPVHEAMQGLVMPRSWLQQVCPCCKQCQKNSFTSRLKTSSRVQPAQSAKRSCKLRVSWQE